MGNDFFGTYTQPNHKVHDCENCDGECYTWAGYHGNAEDSNEPLAPWERSLLGLPETEAPTTLVRSDGMVLEATTHEGRVHTFDNVAVDSARMVRGVLEFEGDDTSTKVRVFYVADVAYWSTYYR